MAVLNGTTKRLSIGGQTIGDEFQSVLDVNLDLPATDSKDDLGWSTHIQGVRSGSLTVACFSNPENTIDFETITGYIITKQTVSFSFNDGIYNITGTGIIQDASEIAGVENTTRYDIDIIIDGAIVQSAAEEFIPLVTSQGYFLLLDNGDYLRLHAEPIQEFTFAMTGTYANSTLACVGGGSSVTIYNHVNYLGLGSRVYATSEQRNTVPSNGWYNYSGSSYYIQDGLITDVVVCP